MTRCSGNRINSILTNLTLYQLTLMSKKIDHVNIFIRILVSPTITKYLERKLTPTPEASDKFTALEGKARFKDIYCILVHPTYWRRIVLFQCFLIFQKEKNQYNGIVPNKIQSLTYTRLQQVVITVNTLHQKQNRAPICFRSGALCQNVISTNEW